MDAKEFRRRNAECVVAAVPPTLIGGTRLFWQCPECGRTHPLNTAMTLGWLKPIKAGCECGEESTIIAGQAQKK